MDKWKQRTTPRPLEFKCDKCGTEFICTYEFCTGINREASKRECGYCPKCNGSSYSICLDNTTITRRGIE